MTVIEADQLHNLYDRSCFPSDMRLVHRYFTQTCRHLGNLKLGPEDIKNIVCMKLDCLGFWV